MVTVVTKTPFRIMAVTTVTNVTTIFIYYYRYTSRNFMEVWKQVETLVTGYTGTEGLTR